MKLKALNSFDLLKSRCVELFLKLKDPGLI
jgi:hypothetical protein